MSIKTAPITSGMCADCSGLDFPTFDYFSNQLWFLQPDYLAALSPGARAFFGR